MFKYYANGIYMTQILPYIQAGIRVLLYAFFPFLFVVVILPKGTTVLAEYLKSIIWIELWTPIMYLLSTFLSIEVTKNFSSFYNEAGFNSINGTTAFLDSFAIAGSAGYLYAFVPAIAWFVLRGNMALMGKLTGRLESIFKKNLMGNDLAAARSAAQSVMEGDAGAYSRAAIAGVASAEGRRLAEMVKSLDHSHTISDVTYLESVMKGREQGGGLSGLIAAGA
jgi:hypothetical protein